MPCHRRLTKEIWAMQTAGQSPASNRAAKPERGVQNRVCLKPRATLHKSQTLLLDTVSTIRGSGWMDDQFAILRLVLNRYRPTRYRRWY